MAPVLVRLPGRLVRPRRGLPGRARAELVRAAGLAPAPSAVVRGVRALTSAAALGVTGLAPRRRELVLERRTYVLGGVSLLSFVAVLLGEAARLWPRQREAPPDPAQPAAGPLGEDERERLRGEAAQANRAAIAAAARLRGEPIPWPPSLPEDVLLAAGETARQTVEVAVAGFRRSTRREAAVFNLLLSFVLASTAVRGSAYLIRRRGRFGPFRNLMVRERHIHHFVPGIVLVAAAGGAALFARGERRGEVLAIPYGVGLALTLDEAALLLVLDDVYWSREGVLSIQITLSAAGLLSLLALAMRLLRRGERAVGPAAPHGPAAPAEAAGPRATGATLTP